MPTSPAVPEALRERPFTTATARSLGLSDSVLRGPEWRQLFRGVHVHADVPDSLALRLAAIVLLLTDAAFVCGLTAAGLYGIDVQDRRTELVWLGCRTGRRMRNRAGVLVREITVAGSDLVVLDGVTLTTAIRTAFDCARWLSLVEAVVVSDFLTHAGWFTPDELLAFAAAHPGIRFVSRVVTVARLTEPLAESPMETRLRLLMWRHELRPQSQFIVLDAFDRFVARADFAFVARRLVVEYDGSDHWKQRREDDRRRDAMRALGWTVIVASAEDYYRWPDQLIARIQAELGAAAA